MKEVGKMQIPPLPSTTLGGQTRRFGSTLRGPSPSSPRGRRGVALCAALARIRPGGAAPLFRPANAATRRPSRPQRESSSSPRRESSSSPQWESSSSPQRESSSSPQQESCAPTTRRSKGPSRASLRPLRPSQLHPLRPSRLRPLRPSQLHPSQLHPSRLRPLRPSQLRPLRLRPLRLRPSRPSRLRPLLLGTCPVVERATFARWKSRGRRVPRRAKAPRREFVPRCTGATSTSTLKTQAARLRSHGEWSASSYRVCLRSGVGPTCSCC